MRADLASTDKVDGRSAIYGQSSKQAGQDTLLLDWIRKELGGEVNNGAIVKAIEHYKKTRLNLRPATVREAVEEFQAWRKSRVEFSTWDSDKWRLLKLIRAIILMPSGRRSKKDHRAR